MSPYQQANPCTTCRHRDVRFRAAPCLGCHRNPGRETFPREDWPLVPADCWVDRYAEEPAASVKKPAPEPTFDRDGWPTDATLDLIRNWPVEDTEGWFKFIFGCWETHYGSVLVKEAGASDWHKGFPVIFATGGWSANESIIQAMQSHSVLWGTWWYSSTRGGRFEFRVRGLKARP